MNLMYFNQFTLLIRLCEILTIGKAKLGKFTFSKYKLLVRKVLCKVQTNNLYKLLVCRVLCKLTIYIRIRDNTLRQSFGELRTVTNNFCLFIDC